MYVRQGWEVLVGMMMASGAGLDLLNIGDDRVQPARPRRLWPDDLCDLELSFRICRAHDGLEFAPLRRFPCVVPNYPGVGRHRILDLAFVPHPAGVEAQFHFTDAVWPTKSDAAKELRLPAERLVMAGAVDA